MTRTLAVSVLLWTFGAQATSRPVVVGSKKFTESVILGEGITALTRHVGHEATHLPELGGTPVVWKAILSGELDVYVEYTGTLQRETLKSLRLHTLDDLRQALLDRGLEMSEPLGFNNTYALAMRQRRAKQLGVSRVSDLVSHPDLKVRVGEEFVLREDGWKGLVKRYGLPQRDVLGIDHDLAYRALDKGDADVIDVYSTDAAVQQYDLAVLEDDRDFFPRYDAVIVWRRDLEERAPRLVEQLRRLAGTLNEAQMTALNAAVKVDGVLEAVAGQRWVDRSLNVEVTAKVDTLTDRLLRTTTEHLVLVLVSLLAAIVVALPLGVLAARHPRLGQAVLSSVGIVQTIPSLALLVVMIPVLGLGRPPSIAALFLYSLLPIVRNTHSGLADLPKSLLESADALGLEPKARLRLIELPLAMRSILAGIKTAAVINVGTATLAAIIGAGGYGQPILRGIRLDRVDLILEGAIPAAVLALVVQWGFDQVEARLTRLPG